LHAGNAFGRPAPAPHRKLELRQRPADTFAQHAQPHHADRKIGAQARLAVRPFALLCVGLVAVELAKMADHGMADIFGHLHRHARIIEPHDRNAGRQAQLEQGIDARADVEDALEPGLFVNELLRRRPDHGVVGGWSACSPRLYLSAGKGSPQAFQPGLGFGVGTAKTDAHAGFRKIQTIAK